MDYLLALVLIAGPTLTYGSKKLLMHSNGHTPVNRVGSRAKVEVHEVHKTECLFNCSMMTMVSITAATVFPALPNLPSKQCVEQLVYA